MVDDSLWLLERATYINIALEHSFLKSMHTSSCLFFFFFWWELYVQILRRVFNILRENSPELVGIWLLTIIWPPQVLREETAKGTKKTVFVNFMDYCKTYEEITISLPLQTFLLLLLEPLLLERSEFSCLYLELKLFQDASKPWSCYGVLACWAGY